METEFIVQAKKALRTIARKPKNQLTAPRSGNRAHASGIFKQSLLFRQKIAFLLFRDRKPDLAHDFQHILPDLALGLVVAVAQDV